MVLQAYIDDSCDQTRSSVFVLGGFLGDSENWEAFSQEWNDQLRKSHIDSFKCSRMPISSAPELVAMYYRIIERHIPLSIDCTLKIPVWKRVVNEFEWPDSTLSRKLKKLVENPYFYTSKRLMQALFGLTRDIGFKGEIDLFFDEQVGEKNSLLEAWDYFKATSHTNSQEQMGAKPSFKDDRNCPPLQAADLIAWFIRKAACEGREPYDCDIFPWREKESNKMKRLAICPNEMEMREELKWIRSPENYEQTISNLHKER